MYGYPHAKLNLVTIHFSRKEFSTLELLPNGFCALSFCQFRSKISNLYLSQPSNVGICTVVTLTRPNYY